MANLKFYIYDITLLQCVILLLLLNILHPKLCLFISLITYYNILHVSLNNLNNDHVKLSTVVETLSIDLHPFTRWEHHCINCYAPNARAFES